MHFLTSKKYTENKNSNVLHTSNDRTMVSTHCSVCNSEKNKQCFWSCSM